MEQLQRKWLRNWIKYYDELSINRRQNMNSYYQFVLKIFSWTLPAVVFLLANLFYITNLEAKDIEISELNKSLSKFYENKIIILSNITKLP